MLQYPHIAYGFLSTNYLVTRATALRYFPLDQLWRSGFACLDRHHRLRGDRHSGQYVDEHSHGDHWYLRYANLSRALKPGQRWGSVNGSKCASIQLTWIFQSMAHDVPLAIRTTFHLDPCGYTRTLRASLSSRFCFHLDNMGWNGFDVSVSLIAN
jgi:hypothetical protein